MNNMENNTPKYNSFVQTFKFRDDISKSGRVLSQVKIGSVYMSRLRIQPGVTTGNYYHKENRVMFYVEKGEVLSACEHVETKERKDMILKQGREIMHLPEYVAIAQRNVGSDEAVVVLFSNYPIRDKNDCFEYQVLNKH